MTLVGRHVRLEPLTPGHGDALWAVARDPELWRWALAPVGRSRVDSVLRAVIHGVLGWLYVVYYVVTR